MALSDTLRLVLFLLSSGSFTSQYMRIAARGNCDGLSGYYILFNLIAATQQFSLGLVYYLFLNDGDILVHSPPTRGDTLNLVQLGVVFGGHLILFGFYLFYPAANPNLRSRISSVFVTFFLISIGVIIILAFLPSEGGPEHDRSWPLALFTYFSSYILNPAATFLAFAAYVYQARDLRSRTDAGALSVPGLLLQAVLFLIVGITWDYRWVLPRGMPRFTFTWYDLGGWAVVDNIAFALVQGALWWIAQGVGYNILGTHAEEGAPLTGSAQPPF